MRIVMVTPGGVDRSGRERVIPALLWLIERLARRHELLVIATSQEADYCEYDLLGARIVCLGETGSAYPAARLFARYSRLRKALRRWGERPDVFHSISAAEIGVLTGLLGRRMNVPVIASVFSGELVRLPEIRYGHQVELQGRLAVWLALRLAAEITAGSLYAGAPLGSRPWHWVPLGADAARLDAPIGRDPGPPWRLMHVAHINPVKDQETLLQAVKHIAGCLPIRLDWFGHDTLGGRLQALSADLGLENVIRFHGVRPFDELIPFYRQAHLLLQTSLHESQSVAVCEAAAAGVPAVGTTVGLVAELAPEAAAGVPVGDAGALAQAALDLLTDNEGREKMGAAARDWARRHDADWTASAFEKLYRKATDG